MNPLESLNEVSTADESLAEKMSIKPIPAKKRFCLLHSYLMPVTFWLIIGVIFYFFAYDILQINYQSITNQKVVDVFQNFGNFFGLVFGFISMLVGFILVLIIKKTALKKINLSYSISAGLMLLPWHLLARQLVFFEKEYTDIGRALIYYIGRPLLSTTRFIFVLILVWLFLEILMLVFKRINLKKTATIASILLVPFLLSGCVGTINQWACQFFDNPDHCYQNAAIQDGDPDACEKITGADFAEAGSNPPKDKCYLKIAENTGDLAACDKINGGMYSYTKEECILNTSTAHKNPDGCAMLSGTDRETCKNEVGPYVYPGSILEIDDQIELLQKELKDNPDETLQKQLDDLEARKQIRLEMMDTKNKQDYESLSDPMNKQVSLEYHLGQIDKKTKDSLTALNDSLREKGEKLSDKEYQTLKDMLTYKNDPQNDIENMDPTEIVKLRWNEKIGNMTEKLKFWKANSTETEKKYDESLLFYQRMLERQAAIEKGLDQKQQDFERNSSMVKDYIKNQLTDAALEEAKKQAFGEMLDLVDSPASAPVTAILGEAIDVVKQEAKSAEFRGLVKAYDTGMQEELAKTGGDVEKAHANVIANLEKNPYTYEDSNTFAKYGNLIENKDCDGTNPHCIKKDVFWKAMKKSYTYQNDK
jgi:hypothetical protein